MLSLSKRRKTVFGSTALATAALGGFLLLAGVPNAQAHDRNACYRRMQKAEWKLNEAIERHGYYSRQAEHRRHDLREARERCWRERHEWWSERDRRWHRDRDWDD
ncbi:MAG: hypothetical protein AUG07_00575 [Acidobacteria bacterium 13_1_20CM_2_60_10]|nr:MAG: hypothetical protein AUG07_00575 [Acidobacteria bacterium 13_1_20CM_2_60_10]